MIDESIVMGDEILSGLTTVAAAGHTPDMATFLVHSGDDQLLLTADLARHPVANIDRPWRLRLRVVAFSTGQPATRSWS